MKLLRFSLKILRTAVPFAFHDIIARIDLYCASELATPVESHRYTDPSPHCRTYKRSVWESDASK
jgi:hypothetical protein